MCFSRTENLNSSFKFKALWREHALTENWSYWKTLIIPILFDYSPSMTTLHTCTLWWNFAKVVTWAIFWVGSHSNALMKAGPVSYVVNFFLQVYYLMVELTYQYITHHKTWNTVAHIHGRGIAHRDIKLQNILIDHNHDRTAQLKLIDFGFGSRFVGALPMRTKCGTPYTTAPEVIRESYDERCDVWSVGVVVYIMLCGKRPFEALEIAGPLADAGEKQILLPDWNHILNFFAFLFRLLFHR